jgi:glucose-6-phosphate isomerase
MPSRDLLVKIDSSCALQSVIADGPVDEKQATSVMQASLNQLLHDKSAGKIGFADVPSDSSTLKDLHAAAALYAKVEIIVVVGIGGSSLGLQASMQALFGTYAREKTQSKNSKPLIIIDTIEPDTVNDALDLVGDRQVLFIAISKSGNTLETLAVFNTITKRFGKSQDAKFFVITDPESGALRESALQNSWPMLTVPSDVGGRYSVLTPVGLFPLLLAGADVKAILSGAKSMENACCDEVAANNPAARLAGVLQAWITRGHTQCVCLPYSDRLRYMTDWLAQLWAESLGKRHDVAGREVRNGSTLIKGLGVLDQHSQLQLYLDGPRDKMTLFISVDHFDTDVTLDIKASAPSPLRSLRGKSLANLLQAEREATRQALSRSSRPSLDLRIAAINEASLGALFQLLMNTVALLGYHQNVDPFDQPAVEMIKELTREYLTSKF